MSHRRKKCRKKTFCQEIPARGLEMAPAGLEQARKIWSFSLECPEVEQIRRWNRLFPFKYFRNPRQIPIMANGSEQDNEMVTQNASPQRVAFINMDRPTCQRQLVPKLFPLCFSRRSPVRSGPNSQLSKYVDPQLCARYCQGQSD